MILIAGVEPGSIASELGVEPGLVLFEINGRPVRDTLDLMFYQADSNLSVVAETGSGDPILFEIEKESGEPLGLVPVPDKVRRCTNACAFCFVKGNPKRSKLRAPLYIKDDDYRLSFLYGHYITLTNLREDDWERVFEQRLSPLYVSVHATEPDVRLSILKNPRSARIQEDLARLTEGRIIVHAQVVLCPDVNDGVHLDRTIEDLYALGPYLESLSIVPVGLTAHNQGTGGRLLTERECRAAIHQIDSVRAVALAERGFGWCYGADELYLQAGLQPPGPDYFDSADLESNGVGSISALKHRVTARLEEMPRRPGLRVLALTGTSLAPSLRELTDSISDRTDSQVRTVAVDNTLYGSMVTSAGLLPGSDLARVLETEDDFDLALFSDQALNEQQLFLDGMSLDELRGRFPGQRVEPSRDFADVLV